MRIEITEESTTALGAYARVLNAFEVNRILDLKVEGSDSGGFIMSERSLNAPYVKDYDAIKGERPADWAERFDMSNWGMFAARLGGRRVGGAVVAFKTEGLLMLEGRSDLAVLWDIRVSPTVRPYQQRAQQTLAADRNSASHPG